MLNALLKYSIVLIMDVDSEIEWDHGKISQGDEEKALLVSVMIFKIFLPLCHCIFH